MKTTSLLNMGAQVLFESSFTEQFTASSSSCRRAICILRQLLAFIYRLFQCSGHHDVRNCNILDSVWAPWPGIVSLPHMKFFYVLPIWKCLCRIGENTLLISIFYQYESRCILNTASNTFVCKITQNICTHRYCILIPS